jgi:hypothetical protein
VLQLDSHAVVFTDAALVDPVLVNGFDLADRRSRHCAHHRLDLFTQRHRSSAISWALDAPLVEALELHLAVENR